MTRAIRAIPVVQQGGAIQISVNGLDPGTSAEVILAEDEPARPSVNQILTGRRGGILYKSSDEVDAAARNERHGIAGAPCEEDAGGKRDLQSRMIGGTIREKLHQVPFAPFVIRASSGQGYRVADPALVVLMKSKVFIAEPRSDRSATVPYLHIAGVEEISNGHPRRPSKGKRRS
jgi:hypothetical protein